MFKHLLTMIGVCPFLLGALTSCLPFERPAAKYPIIAARDILIDGSSFPQDWKADSCGAYCERSEGYGDAMRTYGRPGKPGHVILHITNYVYERSAKEAFQRAEATNFPTRTPHTPPFSTAQPITYISSFADEYELGCGVDIVPACRLYARYSNYFIYLFLNIEGSAGEGLQVAEVDPILEALDKHIAAQLQVSSEQR